MMVNFIADVAFAEYNARHHNIKLASVLLLYLVALTLLHLNGKFD